MTRDIAIPGECVCVLCVILQGDNKFINCMVNATQFHVAGLSNVKKEDYLALNEERVAIQEKR